MEESASWPETVKSSIFIYATLRVREWSLRHVGQNNIEFTELWQLVEKIRVQNRHISQHNTPIILTIVRQLLQCGYIGHQIR